MTGRQRVARRLIPRARSPATPPLTLDMRQQRFLIDFENSEMCGLMTNAVICQSAVDKLVVGKQVISFKQQAIILQ